jgi:hypothetical protein
MEPIVKLQAPQNAGGISLEGTEIKVVDGVVAVPSRFVAVLASHGYVPWIEPPKKSKRILPEGEAPADPTPIPSFVDQK